MIFKGVMTLSWIILSALFLNNYWTDFIQTSCASSGDLHILQSAYAWMIFKQVIAPSWILFSTLFRSIYLMDFSQTSLEVYVWSKFGHGRMILKGVMALSRIFLSTVFLGNHRTHFSQIYRKFQYQVEMCRNVYIIEFLVSFGLFYSTCQEMREGHIELPLSVCVCIIRKVFFFSIWQRSR